MWPLLLAEASATPWTVGVIGAGAIGWLLKQYDRLSKENSHLHDQALQLAKEAIPALTESTSTLKRALDRLDDR